MVFFFFPQRFFVREDGFSDTFALPPEYMSAHHRILYQLLLVSAANAQDRHRKAYGADQHMLLHHPAGYKCGMGHIGTRLSPEREPQRMGDALHLTMPEGRTGLL